MTTQLAEELEHIATLKNSEGPFLAGCFSVLGLYVQMQQGILPPAITGLRNNQNGWLLQAGGKFESDIDAWKLAGESEWHVIKYVPGAWESLIPPTKQLADYLAEYLRGSGDLSWKVNVATGIGERFKQASQLVFPSTSTEEGELAEIGRIANANA